MLSHKHLRAFIGKYFYAGKLVKEVLFLFYAFLIVIFENMQSLLFIKNKGKIILYRSKLVEKYELRLY